MYLDPWKKPQKWAFDKSRTDPAWGWFWNSALLVYPFWESTASAFATNAVQPRDLVSGEILTYNTGIGGWGTSRQGQRVESTSTTAWWSTTRLDSEIFPRATHSSWFVVAQKRDNTVRTNGVSGNNDGTSQRNSLLPHYAASDVYFGFGGGGTGQQISYSDSTRLEMKRFAASAGPSGLHLYEGGILRASYTAGAASRSISTSSVVTINSGGSGLGGADLRDLYFIAALDADVTPGQARQWSNDPYGPLREYRPWRFKAPAAGGSGVIHSLANGGGLAGFGGLAGRAGGMAG